MQPTINPDVIYGGPENQQVQDGVFVKVTTDFQRNDIVIIKHKTSTSDTIIKRVIATAGDKVAIAINTFENNKYLEKEDKWVPDYYFHVFIVKARSNKLEMLEEEYVAEKDRESWMNSIDKRPVPANYTLYKHLDLGKNYSYEKTFYDKFFIGENGQANIHATSFPYSYNLNGETKTENMLLYEIPEGEFFYLGDHRTVSADSRSNGMGKVQNVVGRVIGQIHDAKKLQQEGILWWAKIQTMFSYYWSNIVDYFAW